MKYKNFLFDLDGVLVDTVDIQYNSTIKAISKFVNVDLTDHESILQSTITTKKKLEYLVKQDIIVNEQIQDIYHEKKKIADKEFKNLIVDDEKVKLFTFLKNKNCKIAVVTNGNKNSSVVILKSIGLYDFLDLLITNEDVNNSKPHSEPYVKAISHFRGDLEDFIIFEDSESGLTSAYGTGCKVYKVKNSNDINLSLIKQLNNLNRNVLIPAAGSGSRFQKRGFKSQKPLIELENKTLIEHAITSLNIEGNYIFVIRKMDNNSSNTELIKTLRNIQSECKIIEIDYVTEGSASTCYLAKQYIDNDDELIITNCDQILRWDSEKYLQYSSNYDCSVLTFKSENDKNSFIRTGENNKGIEIREKEVISDNALVGVHYFKKGSYFVKSYEHVFKNNIKFKNEYYVSTVCNQLIIEGKEVVNYSFQENELYYSTGTPEDYFKYMRDHNLLNTKIYKMNDMFRGWYVGNFEPSAYKTTDFEAGYLLHKKGEQWDVHYHKHMTEVNFLVKGKMILNDIELHDGDIFLIDKNEIACPIFLEDCYIFVLKIPSVPGDKIIL